MLSRRPGFTLIELLIVIVIIGILAAIAIPKFGKTREKAYFKAMQSDLRNLVNMQELYYAVPANGYTYATTLANLTEFNTSNGVTIGLVAVGNTGFGATAAHAALAASQTCAVFYRSVSTIPAPALTAGVVSCTGE